jgi:hypothetical protein
MQTTQPTTNIWPDGKNGYTKTWWVTFADAKARCFEGEPTDVETRAAAIGTVKTIRSLPYPAEPREKPYHTRDYGDGKQTACPSFCYTPSACQGRTSCTKNYACSE